MRQEILDLKIHIDTLSESIDKIGASFTGISGKTLQHRGFVLLDLLKRINHNLLALSPLVELLADRLEYKTAIALLLRGGMSNILNGYYLLLYEGDNFISELSVLNRDAIKFHKFIIEEEYWYNNPTISADELDDKIKAELINYKKRNLEFFKTNSDSWDLVSPEEIRIKSTGYFLDASHRKQDITDKIKYETLRAHGMHTQAYSYHLMRYFAQYQHYNFVSRNIMDLPAEFDLFKFQQAIILLTEGVRAFVFTLDVNNDYLKILEELYNQLVEKMATKK